MFTKAFISRCRPKLYANSIETATVALTNALMIHACQKSLAFEMMFRVSCSHTCSPCVIRRHAFRKFERGLSLLPKSADRHATRHCHTKTARLLTISSNDFNGLLCNRYSDFDCLTYNANRRSVPCTIFPTFSRFHFEVATPKRPTRSRTLYSVSEDRRISWLTLPGPLAILRRSGQRL